MLHAMLHSILFLFVLSGQESNSAAKLPLARLPVAPIWGVDGSTLHFVDGAPENANAYRLNSETGEVEPFLDVEKTRAEIAKALGLTLPYKALPFSAFSFVDDKTIAFETLNTNLTLNIETYEVSKSAPASEDEKRKPKFVRSGFSAGLTRHLRGSFP